MYSTDIECTDLEHFEDFRSDRSRSDYCGQMSECYELVVGCKRDSNGYYWITGRTDDCMNVSGHLLSTAQIESALVEHDAVTEAAVVSFETSLACF